MAKEIKFFKEKVKNLKKNPNKNPKRLNLNPGLGDI